MGKKKHKKAKLPKTIAGVKLPKEARKQAQKVIAELRQPVVRDMITGALGMAATALVKQAGSAPVKPAAPSAQPTAPKSGAPFAEIAAGLAMVGLGRLFEAMAAKSDTPKTTPKTPA